MRQMNSSTSIKLLALFGLVELAVIVFLVLPRPEVVPDTILGVLTSGPSRQLVSKAGDASSSVPADLSLEHGKLVHRNQVLENELLEVKKELDIRKSEISFSYGSVRDSGRFVGMTFRKMFETGAAREEQEARARMADNQINVLSLGPFIQDAEVMESDPGVFAKFQAPLVSEVLGIPVERGAELESLLGEFKGRSQKMEAGSPEWIELNDTALAAITGLLSESQKQAMKARIEFFQQYGVLVIPAYSILKVPTPSVVETPGIRLK